MVTMLCVRFTMHFYKYFQVHTQYIIAKIYVNMFRQNFDLLVELHIIIIKRQSIVNYNVNFEIKQGTIMHHCTIMVYFFSIIICFISLSVDFLYQKTTVQIRSSGTLITATTTSLFGCTVSKLIILIASVFYFERRGPDLPLNENQNFTEWYCQSMNITKQTISCPHVCCHLQCSY